MINIDSTLYPKMWLTKFWRWFTMYQPCGCLLYTILSIWYYTFCAVFRYNYFYQTENANMPRAHIYTCHQ